MALLPGSAAIDAGTDIGAPTTDQRGFGRVGAVDIGAFEVQTITKTSTTTTVTGGTFTFDGAAHAGSGSVDVPGGVVTLTYEGINGTSYSSATAPTNAGTYIVTATYAGDDSHYGSTASAALTITPKLLEASASSKGTINLGSNGSIVLHVSVDAGQLYGADTIFSLFNGATFTIAVQNADGSVTYGTLTTVANVESEGSITVSMQMNDSLKANPHASAPDLCQPLLIGPVHLLAVGFGKSLDAPKRILAVRDRQQLAPKAKQLRARIAAFLKPVRVLLGNGRVLRGASHRQNETGVIRHVVSPQRAADAYGRASSRSRASPNNQFSRGCHLVQPPDADR